jgi:hypothetical protein
VWDSLYICHYAKKKNFQFDPQTLFFSDQVLFNEQLISNPYERVGLEDEGLKWKIQQT